MKKSAARTTACPHRNANKLLAAGTVALAVSNVCSAQVSLYGTIDNGITYISNVKGASQIEMQPGIMWKSGIGFRGTEDLGAGNSFFFDVSQSFNASTGANYGFGPQIGVRSNDWGTVTAGQLNDYMFQSLTLSRWGPELYAMPPYNSAAGPFSGFNLAMGSLDFNGVIGWYLYNNAISYRTPAIYGLSLGAMYAFGGVPGHTGRGNTQSFGADYSCGPLQLDAAYTYTRNTDIVNDGQALRNVGVGGRLAVGIGFIDALYTNSRNPNNGAGAQVVSVGGFYPATLNVTLSVHYQYGWGNDVLNSNHYHQVSVGAFYGLSKRTDVYALAAYQRASGDGAVARIGFLPESSSGENQSLLRVGITHRF
ncbi:outer membrane protein (porin)-like protein [Caballeronia hypogeia]|uniref:Outer membrane protein (Porin)-like protein n=1 Tax=Caballeronia hypogeia TaxID=1777140 RepID=A0A158CW74_9BURK|nr:porin [Caballeronia hypogeia]SAK86390.1 outer membrane protein (porin)-like protein [Caballeronia hypogeia]